MTINYYRGYSFEPVQVGPMTWHVGEIAIPQEPGDLSFQTGITSDTGWWAWTRDRVIRKAERAVDRWERHGR